MNIVTKNGPNFDHSVEMKKGDYGMTSCFRQGSQILRPSSGRQLSTTRKMSHSRAHLPVRVVLIQYTYFVKYSKLIINFNYISPFYLLYNCNYDFVNASP
jgi:hypothetical protein